MCDMQQHVNGRAQPTPPQKEGCDAQHSCAGRLQPSVTACVWQSTRTAFSGRTPCFYTPCAVVGASVGTPNRCL